MKHISFTEAIVGGVLILMAVFGLVMGNSTTGQAAPVGRDTSEEVGKIGSVLLEKFQSEGQADFIVKFTEQADLTPAYSMGWEARGDFVYNTLKDYTERAQVEAKARLDQHGLNYRTFIAGNELYVWDGDLVVALNLAALPEVKSIRDTRTYYIDPVDSSYNPLTDIKWAGDLIANNLLTTVKAEEPSVPNALAWGIIDTNADDFWGSFGLQGDGILVANIDTGVEYTHDALDQSYKCGADGTDPACWEDPSNICGGTMCDNNGHGTHTMGTMVADDDPGLTWQAGMAPNAEWIACKGCEGASCSDYALNTCADWILAPGGDPVNRPHVVNNSWGGGSCDDWYQAKIDAWRAAGTFPAFSAGNSTGCGSIGSPGDYQESFASTAHYSNRIHEYSQGPSCYGHDPYTKPNITAPGVSVCSTVPGNGWSCGYSGTSMASPHSAGAVALLWSCNPGLIGQINQTFEALQDSADAPDPPNPGCGVPPDNEGTYEDGYGYLNVLEAGIQNCGPTWRPGPSNPPFEYNRFDGVYNPVDGWIYFPGGRIGSATHDKSIWRYNPTSDDWEDTTCDMLYNAANITAVYIADDGTGRGEAIYVVGGYDVDVAVNIDDVQRYYPSESGCVVEDLPTDLYPDVSPAAQVIGSGGVTEVGGKVYVFGGWESVTPYFSAKTWEFDPLALAGSRWNELTGANLNPARAFIQTATQGGLIYAMGGHTDFVGDLVPTDVVEVFDPYNPSAGWQSLTSMPVPSAEGRGFGFEADTLLGIQQPWMGKLYVAGGGDWPDISAEVMEYDIATDTWNLAFPNLITARRDHAGVFVPVCTSDPNDGLPGMWVFGGNITGDAPPFGDPEYYPLECGEPDIQLDSPSLGLNLFPNQMADLEVNIGNIGSSLLIWSITETGPIMTSRNSTPFEPAGMMPQGPVPDIELSSSVSSVFDEQEPVRPNNPLAVLWDQPLSGSDTTAYANQDFEAANDVYDIFIADDFVNSESWMIDTIFVPGNTWNFGGDLTCANSLNWQIYADGGGMPDGDPWGGGNPPVWNLSLPLGDPQIMLSTGLGGFLSDVTLALNSPVTLSPGTWWFVFYPELDLSTCFQFGRHVSDTTNGAVAMVINPGSGFGFPNVWTSVQDPSTWNLVQQDFAFRFEGMTVPATEIPWLSESPTDGNLQVGETQSVSISYDSSGLAAGDYFAGLLLYSNDPDESYITLPVSLTVHAVGVDITPPSLTMTGDPGSSVFYTVQIENLGNVEDTFDITASGNTWLVNLTDLILTLPPSGVADVTVEVEVPGDVVAGESDIVTVTATSQGDPSVDDSSMLTTTAGYHKIKLPIIFK